jgi:hypothetical protein
MAEVTAADLDLALRRLAEFVTIRERLRIAEIMHFAAAHGDLGLGWLLAASGNYSVEDARAALAEAARSRASGETPN